MPEAETKESIEKKIRKLRKDFQKNVQPVLRRHNYYLLSSESNGANAACCGLPDLPCRNQGRVA